MFQSGGYDKDVWLVSLALSTATVLVSTVNVLTFVDDNTFITRLNWKAVQETMELTQELISLFESFENIMKKRRKCLLPTFSPFFYSVS